VPDVAAAAALAALHLELLGGGVLICVPVPAADELPRPEALAAITQATAEAEAAGVHGPALTPWVLRRVADLTDGRSVRANTALIINDARIAGRLAVALARS
jgi:pseudouridine-5'-phosphate glycosidase